MGQPELDLIVTRDDAASDIYSASGRGVSDGFELDEIAQVGRGQGLFSSLYPDREQPLFPDTKVGGSTGCI